MIKLITTLSDLSSDKISGEHFVDQHMFFFIKKGVTNCYDGNKNYIFKAGDYAIIKKNRLAKYSKEEHNTSTEKVFIYLDEDFLLRFQGKYHFLQLDANMGDTFIPLKKDNRITNYINSLVPYYDENGYIDDLVLDLKREELLLLILKIQPELAAQLFDFSAPQKINLEAYMNINYKFNVSIQHFAYLTGRSISTFKRDFKKIFKETPSRWLIRKRLEEAYYLMEKKKHRPSDIYLELGFETLQHFSYAFKKSFGVAPSQILKKH